MFRSNDYNFIILYKMKKTASASAIFALLYLSVGTVFSAPFIEVGGPIATAGLLDSMFAGYYNYYADIYYDLKNEGYYSPKVFEGYVSRPVFEIAGAAGLEFNVTFFGLYRVSYKTQFNILKLKAGLETFLSTRYLDNACLTGFGNIQVFSITHDLRTNSVQCINDLLENFTQLNPFQKMHNCQIPQG